MTPPVPAEGRSWRQHLPRFLLLAAAVNVLVFIVLHPLDWQQPETIRLRFYGLQAGLKDGPVDGRIRGVDFLKPFVNRAQGGEYESRYPSVLLDGLMAKLYQPLYRSFGPFLKEPTNILLMLLTGAAIFAAARNFFSARAAALSVSAWLLSSQVLLDLCYPVRLNMILAALAFAVTFWRLSLLPRRRPSWGQVVLLVAVFLLGFHSHETTVFLLPLAALIVFSRRGAYRGWGRKLLAGGLAAVGCAFFNMFVLVPALVRSVTGAPPPWAWMNDSLTDVLFNLDDLGSRLRDFSWVGLVHLLRQDGGMSLLLPLWARVIGATAVAGILLLAGWRGIKSAWAFGAGAALLLLGTTLFLFPTVPASVEMEAYYYAPLVVVLALTLGSLLAPICSGTGSRRIVVLSGLLALIGGLNTLNADRVMKDFPYWFGFRGPAQQYVRDVLDLDQLISQSGAKFPAYLAYPRPRSFDISTKWDIMLRTWNVDPPQIFAMMLPVLHLEHFEKGKFLGDPRSFVALSDVPEGEYESQARSFCDLPARKWVDLELLRSRRVLPASEPIFENPESGEKITASLSPGLLGDAPRCRLPAGEWACSLIPRGQTREIACVLAVRADLQARGDEEVYFREVPLPAGVLELEVTSPSQNISQRHTLGWSFQLYRVIVSAGKPVRLRISSEGECELLGPVFLQQGDLTFQSWPGPPVPLT